ncbi:hypothetical protein NPIL_212221 [Nephila pilipes]|uniref:Uncharacterized protein n=1 Tax=Nephila pilipes TaxID=299642 RepID=A0A8X6QHD7_NEPPI|nr:hypothetical protein NPIL_212221 [Nephila pilipes]
MVTPLLLVPSKSLYFIPPPVAEDWFSSPPHCRQPSHSYSCLFPPSLTPSLYHSYPKRKPASPSSSSLISLSPTPTKLIPVYICLAFTIMSS